MRSQRRKGGPTLGKLAMMLILAVAPAAMSPSVAWAKGQKLHAAEIPVKSYLLPYALVVMGVVLGMLCVCRPGSRADEAKASKKANE